MQLRMKTRRPHPQTVLGPAFPRGGSCAGWAPEGYVYWEASVWLANEDGEGVGLGWGEST